MRERKKKRERSRTRGAGGEGGGGREREGEDKEEKEKWEKKKGERDLGTNALYSEDDRRPLQGQPFWGGETGYKLGRGTDPLT